MKMQQEDMNNIICIIDTYFYHCGIEVIKRHSKEPLTGSFFNFKWYDLLYLYYFVEKNCRVHFPSEYLVKHGFNSIEDIAYLVNMAKNCKPEAQ